MIFHFYRSFIDIYESFDANLKRCLSIDILSVLYILLPNKYFLTRRHIYGWLFLLLISFIIAKDGKKSIHKEDSLNFKNNVSKKRSVYHLI